MAQRGVTLVRSASIEPRRLVIACSAASGAAINTTSSQQQQQQPSNNPFLPYEEALWVQHLSATHTLLLNKFNVVPHHVLVVTRQFESQQEPLNANDLAATQQVIVVRHPPFRPFSAQRYDEQLAVQ